MMRFFLKWIVLWACLGLANASILPVHQVLKLSGASGSSGVFHLSIAKGYGLSPSGLKIMDKHGQALPLQVESAKRLEHLGQMIYVQHLTLVTDQSLRPSVLAFQACGLAGYCYPPSQLTLSAKPSVVGASALEAFQICGLFFLLGLMLACTPCVLPTLR